MVYVGLIFRGCKKPKIKQTNFKLSSQLTITTLILNIIAIMKKNNLVLKVNAFKTTKICINLCTERI